MQVQLAATLCYTRLPPLPPRAKSKRGLAGRKEVTGSTSCMHKRGMRDGMIIIGLGRSLLEQCRYIRIASGVSYAPTPQSTNTVCG